MKLIFPTWNECQTPGYFGFLCHHFDNKQYWTCWFLQCCFFSIGRKLECTKIHDLSEIVAEFYAAPHFWVYKKVWPPPHLHQPTPSNKWPVPKHSTFPAFWGGVVWKTSEVSCYYSLFLSAKAVEFNFTRNIMQTEYRTPIVKFRLYEYNRFQMNVSPYDRKSVS